MNKKTFLLLSVLAWGLWLTIMPLRGYNFHWAKSLHSLAFFLLTYWALWKYAPKAGMTKVLVPLLLPWFFELTIRAHDFSNNVATLPITILPMFAIVVAAVFYAYRKFWVLVLGCALWLLGATEGHDRWVEWIAFGEYSNLHPCLAEYEVADSTHTMKLSEVGKDYLLLDVWSSTCGVCIEKMPEVQALYDKYEGNDSISVATLFVYVRDGQTVQDGLEIMASRGCHVPVYGVDWSSGLLNDCGITGFPHVLVLDKKRNVIYNGSLKFASRKLKDL